MIFWASSETYRDVGVYSESVRKLVEPAINEKIEKSILYSLNVTFRYIPIIMPNFLIGKFRDRSKISKADNSYLCAPNLEYEIFKFGNFNDMVNEYTRKISIPNKSFATIGANSDQIETFNLIVREVAKELT